MTTCVILAGGLGTRLRPVLADRPKCLAPVGGTTFLALQMQSLAQRGATRFVLALGHLASLVLQEIEPLRARFGVETVVEPQALGTGGAVLHAMAECGLEECLVTNGDTWLDADIGALLEPLDLGRNERMAGRRDGRRREPLRRGASARSMPERQAPRVDSGYPVSAAADRRSADR